MRKLLLSMALVLCTAGAMAQDVIRLTFNRTNTTEATVNVVDADGNAISGVTATLTGRSHEFKGTDGNITDAILCPDANANTNPTINLVFTINGIAGYYVNEIGLDIHALNGGSTYQDPADNKVRQWNVTTSVGENTFGSLNDIDIAAGVGSSGNVHKMWDITGFTAIDGQTVITITITKGTENGGCFFGLSEIKLVKAPTARTISNKLTASELMEKTEPTYIAIKNLSYTNNRWFVGNTGATPYSEEEFTEDAVFVWEPVTEGTAGSYYLRKLDGTYMQTSAPKDFGTVDAAATFTATAPGTAGTFNSDDDSNLYITGDNDANLVRFVKGSNWINVQNGAGGTPTYNTGTGGWTIHYVYGVTEVMDFSANITDAGYSTFYAPANVEIPEGVKAYYITTEGVNTDYVSMTEITDVIPANTAVILEGALGGYEFKVSDADVTAVSGNLLKGTITSTNVIDEAYVLSKPEDGIGLYKTAMTEIQLSNTSGKVNVFLNNAGKAYLPASSLPAAAQASNGFRFGEGTTGIDQITENRVQSTVIYDLTGRRVETISAPGIYIVGGRKVLVK